MAKMRLLLIAALVFCLITVISGDDKGKGDKGDDKGKGVKGDDKGKGDKGDDKGKGDKGDDKGKGDKGDDKGKGDKGDDKGKGDKGDDKGKGVKGDDKGKGDKGKGVKGEGAGTVERCITVTFASKRHWVKGGEKGKGGGKGEDKGKGDKGNDKGKGDKGDDKGKGDKGKGVKGDDKGKGDKGDDKGKGDKGNDKGKGDKGDDKGKGGIKGDGKGKGKGGERKYFYKPKYMKKIARITLQKALNRNKCKKGETYDYTDGHVWVSDGCSFEAEMCYLRRADDDDTELCGGKQCHMNARCHKNRCKCDKGMIGDGVDNCYSACLCKSWGDPHTTMNDGSTFHFQGACKYLLSRMAGIPGKPECDIDVEAKHEHRNGVTRVSFIRNLDVKVNGTTYTLAPGSKLLVDGLEENAPFTSDDNLVEVMLSKPHLILKVPTCSFDVTYDGKSRASILAPKEYGEKLSGMCGNCNEMRSDDFVTPEGLDLSESPNKAAAWGNYWSVSDDSDFPLATCAQPDVQIRCTEEQSRQAQQLCSRINDDTGPFSLALQESWVKHIADSSTESCVFDVCNELQTGGDAVAAACDRIEDFHTFLKESEFDFVNWRSSGFCPFQCGPNEEYQELMDCPRTCAHDPDVAIACSPMPESGCACRPGFVLSGKDCVKPEMCGCKVGKGRKARYYKIGDSYMSKDCQTEYICTHEGGQSGFKKVTHRPCHQKASCRVNRKTRKRDCQCKRGLVGDGRTNCERECMPGVRCGENARCVRKKGRSFCQCNAPLQGNGIDCAEKCMCTASGDPHYVTFNGQKIHFQGVCTYRLVEVRNGTYGMRVYVKNQQVEGKDVSTTKQVTVYMEPSLDKIVLGQRNTVLVNGNPVIVSNIPVDFPDYTIQLIGEYVVVKHKRCDLTAMFNGKHRAKVLVDKSFGTEAYGICGPCNGKRDVYLTADWRDVSGEPDRFAQIGNSNWMPMPDELEPECKTDDEVPHCDARLMAKITGPQYCGMIADITGPFAECLAVLRELPGLEHRAAKLLEFCQFDVCETWNNPAEVERQKCAAIAAFKMECESYGIGWIDFRSSEFCPMQCGANMRYNPAISMTTPSCDDLRLPQPIDGQISEGCECEDGFLYNPGTDTCVRPEECGCSFPTGYLPLGFKVVNADCTEEKICVQEGGAAGFVYNDLTGCQDNEVCEAREGDSFRRCYCAPGFKMIDGTCQEVCEDGRHKCHEHAHCRRRPGKKPRCRCNRGWQGDGIKECNSECTCTASGDPHYTLFDGKKIHFQGRCTYRLISAGSEACGMVVNVKNQQLKKKMNVSTTKWIEVQMKPSSDKIKIGQGGKVFINRARVFPPIEMDDYTIKRRGKWHIVTSKCNPSFKAQFNGKKLARVSIPREVGPGSTGICGNCDGDKTNDYRLKNGTDVRHLKTKDKFNAIGNSWLVPGPHETEPECMSDSEEPHCDADTNNVLNDGSHCGFMMKPDGPFAECLAFNPELVSGLFNDCIYDTCALWDNPTLVKEQICDTLAVLWFVCGDGEITYRSADMCPPTKECTEPNMVYVQHVVVPQPTCQVPNPLESDLIWPPVDGCECESGFIMDEGLNQCVRPENCGCVLDESPGYIPIGMTIVSSDCTLELTCVPMDGESVVQTRDLGLCDPNENKECVPDGDGIYGCVCKEGYDSTPNGCELIGNCMVGHFFNENTGSCEPCAPGSFTNVEASQSCTLCSAGQFQANAGSTSCDPCPAGKFSTMIGSVRCDVCLPSTHQPDLGQQLCIDCMPGTFSGSGAAECTNCEDGTMTNNGLFCVSCQPGTTSNVGHTECVECEPGCFAAVGGSPACSPCSPGLFQDLSGQPSCKQCLPGSVSRDEGATSCTTCGVGEVANTDQSDCIQCGLGEIPNDDQSNCEKCAPGHISAGFNTTVCTPCPVGMTPDMTQSSCESCKPGSFAHVAALPECVLCPAGSEQPESGKTSCNVCSIGHFSSEGQENCEPCDPGKEPSVDKTECLQCAAGMFSPGAENCRVCSSGEVPNMDQSDCTPCVEGHVAISGDATCTPCNVGEEPSSNRSLCVLCADGHVSTGVKCELCPAGHIPNMDHSDCEACEPGHASPEGSETCTLCGFGEVPNMDRSACEQCPPGHIAMESSESCEPCLAGQEPNADQSACQPCAAGYASASGVVCEQCGTDSIPNADQTACEACPTGTIPNLEGTACVPATTPCDPSPCVRGTCIVSPNNVDYTCNCPFGWTGVHCDERYVLPAALPGGLEPEPSLPPVPGSPSRGPGPVEPVEPTGNPFQQQGCPPGQQRTGFFGLGPCVKCEVGSFKPDPGMGRCQPCDPSTPFSSDDRMRCLGFCEIGEPCQNGGSCHNVNSPDRKYICVCPTGYAGYNCDVSTTPRPPRTTGAPPPTNPPEPEGPLLWRPQPGPGRECIDDEDPRGLRYSGTQSTTTSGATCQEWISMHPHPHGYKAVLKTQRNYCRNPDNLDLPWCFTTNPDIKWEYCNIPYCSKINETQQTPPEDTGCYTRSNNATTYEGPVWYTLSGKRCANWKDISDNMYQYDDNLCRNPTPHVRDAPWCFTEGPDSCIEYCRVPVCPSPPPNPDDQPCIVKEEISLCETKTMLEGNCYYQSGFNDVCDFTVVMDNRQEFTVYLDGIGPEGPVHKLHWNAVGAPESFTDQRCGTRYHVDDFNRITIRRQLCAQCAKKSLDSFMNDIMMGQKSCPAP